MPSKKNRDEATRKLRAALSYIELQRGISPTVLDYVRSMVNDAIDLVHEQDPLKKRIALAVLLLQESTEWRSHEGPSSTTEYPYVVPSKREAFNYAIKIIHEMKEGFLP